MVSAFPSIPRVNRVSVAATVTTCGLSGNTDVSGNATLSPTRDSSITVFFWSSLLSVLEVDLNGGHNGLETIQVSAYCLVQKYKAPGQ